ncbi:M23 family metallopeptidase [Paenibacillus sp. FJAT-26967]|uniref:M23 family metallopeptidase n=1 Tax=Paenibacillus sp. FJAT-26967 TaxID=1729690 RepID=UPI000839168F|nr:M23 family metallopeptidase [Paenibacillus sp. FJAT-26967]
MKTKGNKKELTLMLIPGAGHRVVRFKLRRISLYLVPTTAIIVILGFSLTIYVQNTSYQNTTHQLTETFNGQEKQLTDQLMLKDSELEKLQIELIDLSKQAEQFKARLEEIRKLEDKFSSGPAAGKSESAAGFPSPSALSSMGGPAIPAEERDMTGLASKTRSELSGMITDIEGLITSLTESERKLQEARRTKRITPTIWPSDSRSITSTFGVRRDPFSGSPSVHAGIDIDGELNDPVYAAADGIVSDAEYNPQKGNFIAIDHSRGLQTEYLHLNRTEVRPGSTVRKGQIIGRVGSTGRSTGTHLHYEVHKNGVKINPSPYLISNRKDEE